MPATASHPGGGKGAPWVPPYSSLVYRHLAPFGTTIAGEAVSYDYRSDPILGRALAYWSAKCGARSMPSRRDLDPVVEIPNLLPNLQLIDIVRSRFRFRLIGSELAHAFGRDYTGLFVDELFDGQRARDICTVYGAVRDARQSIFMRSCYFSRRDAEPDAQLFASHLKTCGQNDFVASRGATRSGGRRSAP